MTHPAPLMTAEDLRAELTDWTGRWTRGEISAVDLHRTVGRTADRIPLDLIDAAIDGGPEMLAGELITLVGQVDARTISADKFASVLLVRLATYGPGDEPADDPCAQGCSPADLRAVNAHDDECRACGRIGPVLTV